MTTVTFTDSSLSPWTVPAGVTSVAIALNGAGGGGGGADSSGPGGNGNGGGGGGSCFYTATVTGGSTITYAVGNGGAGGLEGASPNEDGSAGGDTTCSTFSLTAYGGAGGAGETSGSATGVGGSFASGTGITGFTGGNGAIGTGSVGGGGGSSAGTASNGNNAIAAAGGTAVTGGGAGGGGGISGADGTAGSAPGGAGGGGGHRSNGAAGAAGQVSFTYTPVSSASCSLALTQGNSTTSITCLWASIVSHPISSAPISSITPVIVLPQAAIALAQSASTLALNVSQRFSGALTFSSKNSTMAMTVLNATGCSLTMTEAIAITEQNSYLYSLVLNEAKPTAAITVNKQNSGALALAPANSSMAIHVSEVFSCSLAMTENFANALVLSQGSPFLGSAAITEAPPTASILCGEVFSAALTLAPANPSTIISVKEVFSDSLTLRPATPTIEIDTGIRFFAALALTQPNWVSKIKTSHNSLILWQAPVVDNAIIREPYILQKLRDNTPLLQQFTSED